MDTSASLLERLRRPGEEAAWGRFVTLYTPLLFFWARRLGCHDADAADLVQDVLLHLLRKLPEFAYDPNRSFRGWLRTVVINVCRNRRRAELPRAADPPDLEEVADSDPAEALDGAEYRR
jgi:RNA polymerase sigma-70 factor, ECF subfamily